MKRIIVTSILCFTAILVFAQSKKTAEDIRKKALEQETVLDSIDYLKANTDYSATAADKRAVLYFTATLQEQLGLYTDASLSYAKAAGIAGGQAKNMPKVSTEEIVISAVRASLSSGDWETAESYLANIRSSKTEKIVAYTNLYTIWCQLCKASSVNETGDSIAMLRAYSTMQSMKSVKPQVLLTLWYLTDDKNCAQTLKSEYPTSPETAIVNGTGQIMSVPFWYFVPRGESSGAAIPQTESTSKVEPEKKEYVPPKKIDSDIPAESAPIFQGNSNPSKQEAIPLRNKTAGKKQQLGLFKSKANADELIIKVRAKNFDAYAYSETRASGTTYYIVVVDENSSLTMGKKLKDAGFDCYTISN
ncbi:SPOR domain-containing protein [Treponema sp.]|uniref:SPOR domain-containing protein n=1 Tax=Treponema sp. TaxID=166 RepID=UPI00298EB3F6|nr:SPOR domain-containing protein [Treponema sp.]MCQ2241581.1 SPOR domain-containing protein [Treponema sp.]